MVNLLCLIPTGLNQKVANFPGVTVEKHVGNFTYSDVMLGVNYNIELTDLPGTYSIYPKTLDEQIPFRVLIDQKDESHPDKVIVIADATNLKRSLLLLTQITDLGLPTVLALNMMDLVARAGISYDLHMLSNELGIPVIPINARKGSGSEELKSAISKPVEASSKNVFNIYPDLKLAVQSVRERFQLDKNTKHINFCNNRVRSNF